jgi:hypothetical protein
MHIIKTLGTSAAMLLVTAATAMAVPLAMLQDPTLKVEVHTSPTHTVWYTNPVWLAIGGIVALLIIVLAVVATRGRESNTTVVR